MPEHISLYTGLESCGCLNLSWMYIWVKIKCYESLINYPYQIFLVINSKSLLFIYVLEPQNFLSFAFKITCLVHKINRRFICNSYLEIFYKSKGTHYFYSY